MYVFKERKEHCLEDVNKNELMGFLLFKDLSIQQFADSIKQPVNSVRDVLARYCGNVDINSYGVITEAILAALEPYVKEMKRIKKGFK